MADTAISGLPAAAAALGAMELPVNDAATNRKVTVDQLASYGGLKFLGSQTLGAGAARTSDVIWTGSYPILVIRCSIAGYAGGAIGRLILGSGSLSEVATDCSCELTEAGTRNTTSVNVCGWPLAVTANTNPRFAEFVIFNDTGSVARSGIGNGLHGGAAGTVPSGMLMKGFKSAIAQIDRARLTSFTGITGNTVGSNLNAGSYIKVWGLPN